MLDVSARALAVGVLGTSPGSRNRGTPCRCRVGCLNGSLLGPSFAADGIDELLNGFFGRPGGLLVADPPVSMALVPTDIDAGWTLSIEPAGRRLVAGEMPAQLTVVGPASELYLLLWNRSGTERLELRGDAAVLDLWRAKATITWK